MRRHGVTANGPIRKVNLAAPNRVALIALAVEAAGKGQIAFF